MTWICPKCNAKLIGNNNGYTIVSSSKDFHTIKCQKCNIELQLKLMGTSIFDEIHYDEPAYQKVDKL